MSIFNYYFSREGEDYVATHLQGFTQCNFLLIVHDEAHNRDIITIEMKICMKIRIWNSKITVSHVDYSETIINAKSNGCAENYVMPKGPHLR